MPSRIRLAPISAIRSLDSSRLRRNSQALEETTRAKSPTRLFWLHFTLRVIQLTAFRISGSVGREEKRKSLALESSRRNSSRVLVSVSSARTRNASKAAMATFLAPLTSNRRILSAVFRTDSTVIHLQERDGKQLFMAKHI